MLGSSIPTKTVAPIRVVEAKKQYFATGQGLRLILDVTIAPGVSMLVDGCMAWRDKRSKGITVVGPMIRYHSKTSKRASKNVVTFSPAMAKQIAAGLEEHYGAEIQLDQRKFGLEMGDLDPNLPSTIDILPLDD